MAMVLGIPHPAGAEKLHGQSDSLRMETMALYLAFFEESLDWTRPLALYLRGRSKNLATRKTHAVDPMPQNWSNRKLTVRQRHDGYSSGTLPQPPKFG